MTYSKHALALIAALTLASCSEPAPDLPYGTVQLMMANEVQPTAEAYWDSVRFVSELVDGVAVDTDYTPKTEADWLKVEQSAVHLAELGEALKSPAYSEGRDASWGVFAQGLVDVAGVAGEAAKSRDPDKVFEVGGLVYNVCSACHQSFPPADMPPGESQNPPVTGEPADAAE